ncbi:MAG: ABC transporter ATP-binding protein [Planctomycetes bacterium]|nr:ABC transporter ATP-binding protein [Planctomycetota bacterium]
MTLLEARDLRFAYDGREVLSGVSFAVAEGEFLGVIGPNGSGKSTLLRILLGILAPATGEVRLGGDAIRSMPRERIARRAAFLPQGAHSDFAFTVREIVAMGRTPWLGRFRPEGPGDHAAIAGAMRQTGTDPFADRLVTELSGGERQRVFLARAFAQEAPVLVLDEPNANLDLLHAFHLVDLVRQRVRRSAAAVAALHDLTLAARVCDRILVLQEGRVAALGSPGDVLTPDLLRGVFGVRARVSRDEDGHLLVGVQGPAA